MLRRVIVVGAVALMACGSFHGRVADLASDIAGWKLEAGILRGMGERAEGQPANVTACQAHLDSIKTAAADCKAETMRVEAADEVCQPSTKTQPSQCPRCETMLALQKDFIAAKCELK